MTFKPVDTAITMVVGPCIDDTDFKSLEEAITYNAAGMDVSLIVEKTDGTTSVTAITLTTSGTSDWTHKDGGYYEVEVTAAQNAEDGIAYIRGVCTGVLPFESPRYSIVKANVYDSLVKGTDILQTDVTQLAGVTQSLTDLKDFADEGYDTATSKITGTADMRGTDYAALASGVDITHIHGSALTETIDGYLAAAFVKLFDVATPLLVASDVMVGTDDAALAATALTDMTWTDVKAAFIDASIAAIPTTAMRGTDDAALATAVADVQTDLDNPSQYMADISTLATSTALATHDSKLDAVDTNVDAILEDTSTTLETHLTDIKGTGFIKDIDSLPQCLTAVGFSTHDVDAIQTALEADDGKLYAVYAALLNKMTVTSTLMRIYKDDAITLLNELTLSDDDTTVTRV